MSKIDNKRIVFVYADWEGLKGPILMGTLSATHLRGKEIFSFEYNNDWLKSEYLQILDPDLQLYSGLQYLQDETKSNLGIFLDSSPDRWGRILMRRREAALARQEQRTPSNLYETDYLLGVYEGNLEKGTRRFPIDIAEEPLGMYLLIVHSAKYNETIKIIKS